jgi:murein DD-endopeptidase MepM/ murein hydrolase activator NlpD
MAKKKSTDSKPLFKKLRNKYRLVVLNDDTFEEKLSFKLSRLNVFLLTGFIAIVLIASTTVLIAFTPLREYIPGYSSTKLKRQAYSLALQSDSLQQQMSYNKRYVLNLRNIIEGRPPIDFADTLVTDSIVEAELEKSISKNDSLLRAYVENEEAFNVSAQVNPSTSSISANFFTPLKGLVTQSFDPEKDHLGTDVVANENEVIYSALDGIVVFSEWTAETGYVLIVQHANQFITAYKHNSSLLKRQGELVQSGEPIAIIGNTGELSSGPHLHFELWYDGFPVNPENYIAF